MKFQSKNCTINNYRGCILAIAVAPSGKSFVCSNSNCSLFIYSLYPIISLIKVIPTHNIPQTVLAWEEQNTIISGDENGNIFAFDVNSNLNVRIGFHQNVYFE